MKRQYLSQNVYEALQLRLHFLFEEFDNILVSFSGGKDSGLLLNLVMDFQKKYYPERRIGVFHQDFEAQYTVTTEYVERTFARIEKDVEPYWVCLPMATRTALSSYEMYWYPWDDTKEDAWVRPMPEHPYVINLKNNPMTTYRYRMHQEDLAKQFGRWYKLSHGNRKTVCLLGILADESLQRYSGIINKKYGYKNTCWISRQFKDVWCASPMYDWSGSDVWHANYLFHYDYGIINKKYGYKNTCWISRQFKDVWCASPMYDWSGSDVWHANYLFHYDYNRLYDLYYMAGLKPEQMRVASPFNDYAKDSLNLYRVIDSQVWVKLVGRVRGANFGAIYGKTKAMGYKTVTLPEGHTWESYTKFLLATLPERLRQNYMKKFQTSIDFWHNVGGGLEEDTIRELEEHGYNIRRNGVSNYTVMKNCRVIFVGDIPDNTDDIKSTKDIPSWKRMAIRCPLCAIMTRSRINMSL